MHPDFAINKAPKFAAGKMGRNKQFPSLELGLWKGPLICTTEEYPHIGTSSEILRPTNYDPGY